MSTRIMTRFDLVLLFFVHLVDYNQGQLCTVNYLPASQYIEMYESARPGDSIAVLPIIGSSSEISLRLVHNSSEVKTNGSSYFTLNFTNLYLARTLDYDWWTLSNYPNPFRFIVECIILSNQTVQSIDFQLDLRDVNDNAPVFDRPIYYVNVSETTPVNSTIFTEISAIDIDSVPYRSFVYFLQTNSSLYVSYFRLINSMNSSLVLVKSLDFNRMTPTFNMTIVAQDTNNASLLSQSIISITIIDVDNLNPAFSSSSYSLNMSIETEPNVELIPNEGRIFAYDQDFGINASIVYSILTPNIYLTIDNQTGRLYLRTVFNSTNDLTVLIKAQQVDNRNRTATITLHVSVFELNNYAPIFADSPYVLIGYSTVNVNEYPSFIGTISDNDTRPRLTYSSSCDVTSLNLNMRSILLRTFQVQLISVVGLPRCDPCRCTLNVSDGRFSSTANLSIILYDSPSFNISSSLFSINFSSTNALINIGVIPVVNDQRCSVQYSLDESSRRVFSITQNGLLYWSDVSNRPDRNAYEIRVDVQQTCSSLIRNISSRVFVTFQNVPSSTNVYSSTSTSNDNTLIYAIIASVAAFILIVIGILFIILYYNIQRAKHRVPSLFNNDKRSPAHGLTFFRSKRSLSPKPPYTLDVRDDESSSSTSSDQSVSSPDHKKTWIDPRKSNDGAPVMNTTVEELLSSYDNRSTSSSSSSLADVPTTARNFLPFHSHYHENNLGTIDENLQWIGRPASILRPVRVPIISEDAIEIISESHESSASGSGSDIATSVSTLLQPQRTTNKPKSNEHLTVFV